VRLFVAIPLPADVAAHAAATVGDVPGLRRVAPQLMHVTLAFLGATADERLQDVVDCVTDAARRIGSFTIELDRAGRFPASGPPRVIWLGIGAGATEANALASAIRERLASRALSFDEKPFRPHVTLGRVREIATRDEARAIGAAIDSARVADLRFVADAVHVVESHISSKGPRYTSRASVPLVGGSGERGSTGIDRRARDV